MIWEHENVYSGLTGGLKIMKFQTRVTEMIGIRYPIMMGGMQNVATPKLCAAVSEAGGLGCTNISMYPDFDDFRAALKEIKSLTSKPFAVNISMIPNVDMGDKIRQYIDICGEEGVRVIETAGKDPSDLVEKIHSYGMIHIHKVPAVKHALKAEKGGVDIVSIVGAEAAGHPSPDMIGTMIVGNKAAKQVSIPLLIGGGIVDGASFAAALALGADGVVIGTRFVASTDCEISMNHRNWIVEHTERDTIICQKAIKNAVRVAHNQAADECLALEAQPGCTLKTLMPIISGAAGKAAYASGDTSKGMFAIGQAIGLIDELKSAKEIIDEIIEDGEKSLRQAYALIGE